ncbi:MAG TPA: SRPBCC family protein [Acidimicrobiales bacterium]
MRVCVSTQITAPVERVWNALTVPDEVSVWDGVTALDVPVDYPQVGHHARWHSAFGPLRLTLHDRVLVVEERLRLAATIDIAFIHVDEEYRLSPIAEGGTMLVTSDEVRSRVPGLSWFAVRLTRANVVSSMERLKEFCERPTRM